MKYPYIIKILSLDGSLINLPFTAAKPVAEIEREKVWNKILSAPAFATILFCTHGV